MFKGLEPTFYGGREVWPLVEGGKGVSASNHQSSGAWAAAGGIGTVSAVNADSYDPDGKIVPQVYDQLTRRERHEQLIRYAIDGAVHQVERAHDIAGGRGAININVLWEMGGAEPILHGVLERARGLVAVVADGAGLKGELFAVPTDVTDENSVRQLFEATTERYSRVDLLFNNAGTGAPAVEFGKHELEAWNRVLAVNLTGAFLCTREAFRVMGGQTPQGGRIINNGSIAAYAPRPRSVAYTATKHAVSGLTKAAALDGRAYNIACGQLDIGNAATEMGSGAAAGTLQADGSVRPEPLMDVSEVGRAVLYMASLPLGANVLNMTVMATKMPFVGRG